MSKSQVLHVRIDPGLKEGAETIFESLGLNVSQAISLFFRQVELHRGLPFEVALPNATTRRTLEKVRRGEELVVCKDAGDMRSKLGI